jgi:hypothetical protein
MCLSGRIFGSSSSVPAGTSSHDALSDATGTGDPQRLQKELVYGGGASIIGASNVFMSSCPCTMRKSSPRTLRPAPKAEPLAFLHLLQWQSSNGPVVPRISNLMPPQRQPPQIIWHLPTKCAYASTAVQRPRPGAPSERSDQEKLGRATRVQHVGWNALLGA